MCWGLYTLIYLISLSITIWGSGYSLDDNAFLGPDPRVLNMFGALNRWEIRYNWQAWRLITSLFLCPGIMYYATNSGALMIAGFICENKKMSLFKMGALFLGIGFLANLFTICCENSLSIGPQGAISGMFFALFASVGINWRPLSKMANGMFGIILIMFILIDWLIYFMFCYNT